MHAFRLYLTFIKIRLQSLMEYRVAFLSGAIAQIASYGATFLLVWIMIQRFQTLHGWTPYEVMVLYAFNLLSYALSAFFMFNFCRELPTMVLTGEFDEVLTKPIDPFFYVICRDFNTGYIAHLILSIVVLTVSFRELGIQLNLWSSLFLLLVIAGGACIQGAAFLFSATLTFWLIRNSLSVQRVLMFELSEFTRYPVSLYGDTTQFIFTIIIPYAFINFYPAQYFLKKQDFSIFHPAVQYMTPLVGIVLFLLAYQFWKFGVSQYSSTGS